MVKVGDLVPFLMEAEVKPEMHSKKLMVHYLVAPDEWVAQDRVLEDTPANRELHSKANEAARASASFDTFCGPKRLDAIAAWMNTVDDALVRLAQDVKKVVHHQEQQAAQLQALERRKKEAMEEKAALEGAVLKELTRVRVAEETAMARQRLKNAGVSQAEMDAILPVIRAAD